MLKESNLAQPVYAGRVLYTDLTRWKETGKAGIFAIIATVCSISVPEPRRLLVIHIS